MTDTVINRDETGETTIGETTINIPKDRSVLSVVPYNAIRDGDDFREDGWVYGPDGKQRRKWFVSIGDWNRLMWSPKLKDLATLEAKRWKWLHRAKVHNQPFFGPAFDKARAAIDEVDQKGDEGRAKIGGWAEITVREAWSGVQKKEKWRVIKGWVELSGGQGIGWSWVSEKPDNINQPVVDEWIKGERRWMLRGSRSGLIRSAFLRAVDENYWEKWSAEAGDYTIALHLEINGRDYWFTRAQRHCGKFFEKLAWPEDTMTEIITAKV